MYLDGHCQPQRNEERADHVLHDDEQAAEQLLVLQAEVPLYNIYRMVSMHDEGRNQSRYAGDSHQ